jgi:cardiolipin synthase
MISHFLSGNQLRLLESGAEFFPALLEEIVRARHEIHIETYIFEADRSGQAVAAALTAAARRGVAVRILVDGFGAREFPAALGQSLAAAGAEVLTYRPEAGRFALRRGRLRRLHRKLSVFDGTVAFVGGINIIDDQNTPHQTPPRFDYAVRIEGPVVAQVHGVMRGLWRLVRWATLGRRPPAPPALPLAPEVRGEITARLVVRDNLRHRRDIESAYLEAIAAARNEILLANAYFLPGRRFRKALMAASRRGVKVTLLLQGRVEYVLMHYATLALYGILLKTGIRIFEYRAGFLHAKVAVVDREWVTVGSSNIDPFSLLLAREANLIVRDVPFAALLKDRLEQAIARGGVEIQSRDLRARPWYTRLTSRVAYALVRVLVGVTGYGGGKSNP